MTGPNPAIGQKVDQAGGNGHGTCIVAKVAGKKLWKCQKGENHNGQHGKHHVLLRRVDDYRPLVPIYGDIRRRGHEGKAVINMFFTWETA